MPEAPRLPNPRRARALLLGCFVLSGFTALLYQTVWLRLALAKFGVNTSVVATVLSVFMLGLAAGSGFATRLSAWLERRLRIGPLRLYGLAELSVALGGVAVPHLLSAGRHVLLTVGAASGAAYTLGSTAILTTILLPFCTAMGLTFPTAVAFLRRSGATTGGRDPFSALYLANVVGAFAGAIATPIWLIELYGFLTTCRGAAVVNVVIGTAALAAFRRARIEDAEFAAPAPAPIPLDPEARSRRLALFVTGFSTMGMEVVWTRIYPTVVGTFVYSFAAIIASYLLATTLGSFAYRRLRLRPAAGRLGLWWPLLCAASMMPLLSASTTFPKIGLVRVFVGLAPFCALLGFLTPALVDREAGDDAASVGRAYAINLLGCLLGPLAAGFVLLPAVGTRWTELALAFPLFLVLATPVVRRDGSTLLRVAGIGVAAGIWFSSTLFEEYFPQAQVRYDNVATVVATGVGDKKQLYVNGVGITELTTITKMMAHLPASHVRPRDGRPIDALVICFGMGTSFRSLASWGANVVAVELVPSVAELFGYYYPEGPGLVARSGGRLRIVTDDGRRFLDRSRETFDVITIDPPPPAEAASSSLLYSKEFYASARRKMKPGAILQMWFPEGDPESIAGAVLSALESFPYVRVMGSFEGVGFHILASNEPIERLTADEAVARMPEAAVKDLTEWIHEPPAKFFEYTFANEFVPESMLLPGPRAATQAITDDRAVNEFYLLRRWARGMQVRPPTAGAHRSPTAP